MTENLKTIQGMIEKTKDALSNCKPASLKESDIDKAAKTRSMLRDKLTLLEAEEQSELQAIAEAEALDKQERRESLFRSIIVNYQKDKEKYCSFNEEIEEKLLEVFTLMAKKDSLFSSESLGIKTADLTQEEIQELFDYIRHSRLSEAAYEKELGCLWSLVLGKTINPELRLYSALKSFPERYQHPEKMSSFYSPAIKSWAEKMLEKPLETDEEKDTGSL
ncbi:hypothetical protein V3H25_22585 [Vibrio parahaemolyticus]|uniref:hypothetical protein n=1 Tax=Vibrio parahaemolyticus TaxID=670 RepID=UPI003B66BAB4